MKVSSETCRSTTTDLIRLAQETAKGSPNIFPELYSTCDFINGENRICHQRTMALLAHAAWQLPNAPAVELEDSFVVGSGDHPNKPGRKKAIKWEPDLILRDSGQKEKVVLLVDFESPNSSDFRVVTRDICQWYLGWVAHREHIPEYLIITSLPDAPALSWECRYTQADGYDKTEARKNPYRYWYGIYKASFEPAWKSYPIVFANFNGKNLEQVDLEKITATQAVPRRLYDG